MVWMTSDWTILLLASAVILSVLAVLLLRNKGLLERRLGIQTLNRLLKGFAAYAVIFVPVIAGWILYRMTFHDIRPFDGEDGLDTMYIIGNRSLSTETGLGNHWCFGLLLLVWLLGLLTIAVFRSVKSRRAMYWLKRSSAQRTDDDLEALKDRLIREYNIKQPVELLFNDYITTAFTTGIRRSRIFFPTGGSREDRELMLRHELIHCRERDTVCRLTLSWLCILYWFHPLVYRLRDYIIEANEMACDEQVLNGVSGQVRYQYAKLLAETAEATEKYGMVSFSLQTESSIERRIEHMTETKRKTGKVMSLLLSMIFAAACPLTTFAAAAGVSELQDQAARALAVEYEEEPQAPVYVEEFYEVDTNPNERELETEPLQTRGVSTIDDTDINGTELVVVATVKLEKDDEITIWLKSDNTTDKFRAGLKDSSGGKRYVTSSNGKVDHTFTISSTGTYKVFVEGTTSNVIHVYGSLML